MGEKDIVEKTLEAYNEVFADIVNVLLFKGEQAGPLCLIKLRVQKRIPANYSFDHILF